MSGAFTPEYVEGLRREGQRKGARIRELEAQVREQDARILALVATLNARDTELRPPPLPRAS